MRTHTCQRQLATPVPASTPPEHRPSTEDRPGTWDHQATRAQGRTAVAELPPSDATLVALERKRGEQLGD